MVNFQNYNKDFKESNKFSHRKKIHIYMVNFQNYNKDFNCIAILIINYMI